MNGSRHGTVIVWLDGISWGHVLLRDAEWWSSIDEPTKRHLSTYLPVQLLDQIKTKMQVLTQPRQNSTSDLILEHQSAIRRRALANCPSIGGSRFSMSVRQCVCLLWFAAWSMYYVQDARKFNKNCSIAAPPVPCHSMSELLLTSLMKKIGTLAEPLENIRS